MARVVTFGKMPDTMPKGNYRMVTWTQLALLDQGTNEGFVNRILNSDGGDTRELPRTFSMQYVDDVGHLRSVPVGSVWEVTIDGEAGVMSGRGFLADTPDGHLCELAAVSKALHHNSVDLAEIPPGGYEIIEYGDWWDDDFHIDVKFNVWKFAKTTAVATPAFANARYEISDEIQAALGVDTPLVIDIPSVASGHTALEVAAGLTVEGLPRFEYFHRPEADIPHKIMVSEPDEHGWCEVYGHLARWGQPHTGLTGNVYAPRSRNDYARFCQPSVLTDKGMVRTGPISLYDGHQSLDKCADDPATAWADVRVVDGRHGPWMSGVARPHISHEMAERYAARASRTSGHWKNDELRMIVSVNAEGYPIDYQQGAGEIAASFSFDDDETAAGFTLPRALTHFGQLSDADLIALRDMFKPASDTSASGGNRPIVLRGPTAALEAVGEQARLLRESGKNQDEIITALVEAGAIKLTDQADSFTVDPVFDVDEAHAERMRILAAEDELEGA